MFLTFIHRLHLRQNQAPRYLPSRCPTGQILHSAALLRSYLSGERRRPNSQHDLSRRLDLMTIGTLRQDLSALHGVVWIYRRCPVPPLVDRFLLLFLPLRAGSGLLAFPPLRGRECKHHQSHSPRRYRSSSAVLVPRKVVTSLKCMSLWRHYIYSLTLG